MKYNVEKISSIILCIVGCVLVVDAFLLQFLNIGTFQNTLVISYCVAFVLCSIKYPNLQKNKFVVFPLYIMIIQTFYSLFLMYFK